MKTGSKVRFWYGVLLLMVRRAAADGPGMDPFDEFRPGFWLRFEVSVPPDVRPEPTTGRVYVIISRTGRIGETNGHSPRNGKSCGRRPGG